MTLSSMRRKRMEKWKTVSSTCRATEYCYPSTSSGPTLEIEASCQQQPCMALPKGRYLSSLSLLKDLQYLSDLPCSDSGRRG